MVKIKRKVEMTLPELVEWGFKNNVKNREFSRNHKYFKPVVFNSCGYVDFKDDYAYSPEDTFTVEVEEEITEETKIPEMLEIFVNDGGVKRVEKSINELKDDFSKEFWLKDGNTMTLIWKDGELVGDE
ncbi:MULTISPECIES: hypothetical protein [Bacillati]|uniref:hypothetical protein n=1 Tax=Bacillati TaxID=1783272 RepID=UPI001187BF1A|nr:MULTISPECIES: hypothetical protein [Staphylococcus]EAF9399142.1 hypothetical protein [Listeria monocytogenes]MCG1574799.1 hypothetical protein [Staphylococcus epidermidis]MDH8783389.1 hypothetical protein [Staphylococcus epidermidis]MDH8930353.1 hypothetical protein [Staphylococcus epidermidis]NAM28984.1 hypothetical protein [Staphylococcus epidermidis]